MVWASWATLVLGLSSLSWATGIFGYTGSLGYWDVAGLFGYNGSEVFGPVFGFL
ncbi:hypothetical protein ES332_A03G176200v1 [Gossypium tomentosum]|uniref:Uncharacterized protein n=1 Tax=Gossypium tomentosum TaxID=34277 RepID=A0A5D2R874_GOSTO|nr:hypothetical protein ES332_A03G176200v1 [Gossypium tomentosum]